MNKSYAIWNNKGGVGKTFLSFVIATEYAERNPDTVVIVIDMCPQANVSEILLGGNGVGTAHLAQLLKGSRKTIGGYFDERLMQPHKLTGNETSYLIQLSQYNKNLPTNLYLVAGDPSLEIQTQSINQIAAQNLPPESWKNVHKWVFDMVQALYVPHPKATVFIDCNPSFSAYTELAIVASSRIIVPCTADGSSARAIDNIGQLLYGFNVPSAYQGVTFSYNAALYNLATPKIHIVPLNRSTQYDKKASKAFGAMYTEIKSRVQNLMAVSKNQIFSTSKLEDLYIDIPDNHSVTVVSSSKGLPLSKLKAGPHTIHGVKAQINTRPLERYKKAVDRLISLL